MSNKKVDSLKFIIWYCMIVEGLYGFDIGCLYMGWRSHPLFINILFAIVLPAGFLFMPYGLYRIILKASKKQQKS